jgi:two-component system LytT family response regulator
MNGRRESLTVLIVDDEPLARDGLRMLLEADPGVSTILEARNGEESVSSILSRRPDLVFLDVQMPEMDGFSVVQEVGAERMPAVVFVTAHDQYAIQAFEVNAIDYLLKPVTAPRFAQALERARARMSFSDEASRRMISLLETLASSTRYLKRLAVRSTNRTTFVNVEDVHWIKAAENYVELHVGAVCHLVHVPIGTLQSSLEPEMFLRIHRSLIVNVREIKELQPGFHGEYVVILRSGVCLQSSRSYHEKIKAWAANPF